MPRVIDLTHPVEPGMPVFPGTEGPTFEVPFNVADHGFHEHRLTMVTHTGTHLDTPAHMIAGGRTLDTYPPDSFAGLAVVLDLTACGPAAAPAARAITRAHLEPHADRLAAARFALLRTDWSAHWGAPAYFTDFPALAPDAAAYLTGFDLAAVGLETPSADLAPNTTYPAHHTLLGADLLILENLTSLAALPATPFLLAALPLNLTAADGSPIRAMAFLD